MGVLLAEFELNRRTITERSGDELVALKTSSWDANQQMVRGLSPALRDQLESIYVDINLLNHLVWLSSEFNRNSPSMRQHYLELGQSIASRFDRLISDARSQETKTEPANTFPVGV
jgi:hypothetical protein